MPVPPSGASRGVHGQTLRMSDSLELLNRLSVSNVLLDNRMYNLKAKIAGKKDEVGRIEDEIRREQSDLARIEEDLSDGKSKEGKLLKTVQGLQQTKSMLANLKSTLERGIRSVQENFSRVVSERNGILDRYRRTIEAHRTGYESLKAYRSISAKRAERASLKILIKKCRFDLLEYKAKVAKLRKISALRLNSAVVEFAKLMVTMKNASLLQVQPQPYRRTDDFSEEKAALARSGVTLTVRKVPMKMTILQSGFTSIKERIGVKSTFTSPYVWEEGGPKSFQEEFTPQAASSQNPLEYTFPPGTSISIVSPTVEDPSMSMDDISQNISAIFQF
ncbi:uncharacterized protein LOC106670844 isoform X2 [Cimex lectularius]|uniref:Uncharacterized protein n=1 Tax=Cimex lectularius TaxID=79782 RepID=A0A8I6S6E3_CIMLE|nr:uncharacterized protein LOC106670844 isoform X2 [Cimex lectularius]